MCAYAGGRLHQEAAPELKALRQQPSWSASRLEVSAEQAVAVEKVTGPSWMATFTLTRGKAAASGLLLRSWLYEGPEQEQPSAAALLLNWETSSLEVSQHCLVHHGAQWQINESRLSNVSMFYHAEVACMVCIHRLCKSLF